MSTRPSTPCYFYNDLDGQHNDEAASSTGTGGSDETEDTNDASSSLGNSGTLYYGQDVDPPPSYASSSASSSSSLPSSLLSSPRSSSSLSNGSSSSSGRARTSISNAATVIDMGPLHMTPAHPSISGGRDLRNRSHGGSSNSTAVAVANSTATSLDPSGGRSSLDGAASSTGSSSGSGESRSSADDFESGTTPVVISGFLAGNRSQRMDDSSVRTLRSGGALDNTGGSNSSNSTLMPAATSTSVAPGNGLFTSRLISRTGSPALGQPSGSTGVHHHIHHHYHHGGSEGGSGSTSALESTSSSSTATAIGGTGTANTPSKPYGTATTSSTAPSSVTSSPQSRGLALSPSSVALGLTRSTSSQGVPTNSSSNSKNNNNNSSGRKSKEWGRFLPPYTSLTGLTSINGTSGNDKRHQQHDSSDYNIPDDGYFFAENGYHYRSGPLARKLGSAMLSREPSFTDLHMLATTSGGGTGTSTGTSTPGGGSLYGVLPRTMSSSSISPAAAAQAAAAAAHASSRRRAGWKSPRRSGGGHHGHHAHSHHGGFDGGFAGSTPSTSEDFGIFDALLTPSSGILPTSTSSSASSSGISPYRSRRRFSAFVPLGLQKWWYRFLRHPLVPTQPLTLLFALALFASFAFSVTTFMYHILSTDKAPRPWRQYCQEQRPFPHELADSLDPVDVFVGVFSVDAAYERRHLIRSTYLRHSRPIDPITGKAATNVQFKFILGRPRKHHARRIALEMETYNDIVVLDMKENMNQGKTHTFFKWANENATVPIYYHAPKGAKRIGALDPPPASSSSSRDNSLTLGFKKADYIVKADDDSFLVLSELERHLRVAPRTNTYWGYLIRNLFMGGECYALSADLVNYVATNPALDAYTTGAEDKRVAKWMRMHPNASSINWVTERCYVYDHPKAATTYSHGFLFPDEVERVRGEAQTGISAAERARRGGELADAWSSVSKWKKAYVKPKKEMTIEEEVEALIEGGGRWTALDGWTNKISHKDVVQWDNVVFENQDTRIKGGAESTARADEARAEYNLRSESAFGKYNRIPNSLLRDPGDLDIRPQHAKRSWEFWKRDSIPVQLEEAISMSTSSSLPVSSAALESFANITSLSNDGQEAKSADAQQSATEENGRYEPPRQPGAQYPIGSSPGFKKGFSFLPDAPTNPDTLKQRAVPAPTLRYDPSTMTLRERRFLGLPYGGTVVVHYLKRNEWFLETALALLGRQNFWDTGLDAPAYPPIVPPHRSNGNGEEEDTSRPHRDNRLVSPIPSWNGKGGQLDTVPGEWGSPRMYGSPLVKENGFVSLGRSVPWDALQKSEEGKYGKLRGSPRQRFTDQEPDNGEAGDKKDHKDDQEQEDPTDKPAGHLVTRSKLSDTSTPKSSSSDLKVPTTQPDGQSASISHSAEYSHSHVASSLIESPSKSLEEATHSHPNTHVEASSSMPAKEAITSKGGLHFQDGAVAPLEFR